MGLLMQISGQVVPVAASGFQTGMDTGGAVFGEPAAQPGERFGAVMELAAIGLVIDQQGHLIGVFGNVYAEGGKGHGEGS